MMYKLFLLHDADYKMYNIIFKYEVFCNKELKVV